VSASSSGGSALKSRLLGVVNTALGGGSTTDSIANLDPMTFDVNGAFEGGAPSSFAQTNLFPAACP